jgi:hypothetical protein
VLSGGVANYLQVMGAFSERFQSTTSLLEGAGWWGLRRNLIKLTLYTLYGWSVAIVPALVFIAVRLWRRAWPRRWENIIFLGLWILPALLFYTVIHMGQQGLVFVFLPALLLLSAVGLVRLLTARPRWIMPLTAVLVGVNVAVFLVLPEYPLGPNTQRLLTRETLVNSDRYYQDRVHTIRANFEPGSTVILADSWRHVQYYLPEYSRLPFNIGSKWEINEGEARGHVGPARLSAGDLGLKPDTTGAVQIVIFDPELEAFTATPDHLKTAPMTNGGQLAYMNLGANEQLYFEAQTFGIRPK